MDIEEYDERSALLDELEQPRHLATIINNPAKISTETMKYDGLKTLSNAILNILLKNMLNTNTNIVMILLKEYNLNAERDGYIAWLEKCINELSTLSTVFTGKINSKSWVTSEIVIFNTVAAITDLLGMLGELNAIIKRTHTGQLNGIETDFLVKYFTTHYQYDLRKMIQLSYLMDDFENNGKTSIQNKKYIIFPTKSKILQQSTNSFFNSHGQDVDDTHTSNREWDNLISSTIPLTYHNSCASIFKNVNERDLIKIDIENTNFKRIIPLRIFDSVSSIFSEIEPKMREYYSKKYSHIHDFIYSADDFNNKSINVDNHGNIIQNLHTILERSVDNSIYEITRFLKYIEDSYNNIYSKLDANLDNIGNTNHLKYQSKYHYDIFKRTSDRSDCEDIDSCIQLFDQLQSFIREDNAKKNAATHSTTRNNGLHAPQYSTHLICYEISDLTVAHNDIASRDFNLDNHPLDSGPPMVAYISAIMRNSSLEASVKGQYITFRWCKMYEGTAFKPPVEITQYNPVENIIRYIQKNIITNILHNIANQASIYLSKISTFESEEFKRTIKEKVRSELLKPQIIADFVYNSADNTVHLNGIYLPVSFVIHNISTRNNITNVPKFLYDEETFNQSFNIATNVNMMDVCHVYPKLHVKTATTSCEQNCVIHYNNIIQDLNPKDFGMVSLDITENTLSNELYQILGVYNSFEASVTLKNFTPNIPINSHYDVNMVFLTSHTILLDLKISDRLSNMKSFSILHEFYKDVDIYDEYSVRTPRNNTTPHPKDASVWYINKPLIEYCRIKHRNRKEEEGSIIQILCEKYTLFVSDLCQEIIVKFKDIITNNIFTEPQPSLDNSHTIDSFPNLVKGLEKFGHCVSIFEKFVLSTVRYIGLYTRDHIIKIMGGINTKIVNILTGWVEKGFSNIMIRKNHPGGEKNHYILLEVFDVIYKTISEERLEEKLKSNIQIPFQLEYTDIFKFSFDNSLIELSKKPRHNQSKDDDAFRKYSNCKVETKHFHYDEKLLRIPYYGYLSDFSCILPATVKSSKIILDVPFGKLKNETNPVDGNISKSPKIFILMDSIKMNSLDIVSEHNDVFNLIYDIVDKSAVINIVETARNYVESELSIPSLSNLNTLNEFKFVEHYNVLKDLNCRSFLEIVYATKNSIILSTSRLEDCVSGENIWNSYKKIICTAICAYDKNETENFIYNGSLSMDETSAKYENFQPSGNFICINTARDQESKLQLSFMKRCAKVEEKRIQDMLKRELEPIVRNIIPNNAESDDMDVEEPEENTVGMNNTKDELLGYSDNLLYTLDKIIHKPRSAGVFGNIMFGDSNDWIYPINDAVVELRDGEHKSIPNEAHRWRIHENARIFLHRVYSRFDLFGLVDVDRFTKNDTWARVNDKNVSKEHEIRNRREQHKIMILKRSRGEPLSDESVKLKKTKLEKNQTDSKKSEYFNRFICIRHFKDNDKVTDRKMYHNMNNGIDNIARTIDMDATKISNLKLHYTTSTLNFSDDVRQHYENTSKNTISDNLKTPYYNRDDISIPNRSNGDISSNEKIYKTMHGGDHYINMKMLRSIFTGLLTNSRCKNNQTLKPSDLYEMYVKIVLECSSNIQRITSNNSDKIRSFMMIYDKQSHSINTGYKNIEWLVSCLDHYKFALKKLLELNYIASMGVETNSEFNTIFGSTNPLIAIIRHKIIYLEHLVKPEQERKDLQGIITNYKNRLTKLRNIMNLMNAYFRIIHDSISRPGLNSLNHINKGNMTFTSENIFKDVKESKKYDIGNPNTNLGEVAISDEFKSLIFSLSNPCDHMTTHPFDWFSLCKTQCREDRIFYDVASELEFQGADFCIDLIDYNYFGCFLESLLDCRLEISILYDITSGLLDKPNVLGRYYAHSGVSRNPTVSTSGLKTFSYYRKNDELNEILKSDIVLCEKYFQNLGLTTDDKSFLLHFHNNFKQNVSYATLDGNLLPITSEIMDACLKPEYTVSFDNNTSSRRITSPNINLPNVVSYYEILKTDTGDYTFDELFTRYDAIVDSSISDMKQNKNISILSNIANVRYSSYYYDLRYIDKATDDTIKIYDVSKYFDAGSVLKILTGINISQSVNKNAHDTIAILKNMFSGLNNGSSIVSTHPILTNNPNYDSNIPVNDRYNRRSILASELRNDYTMDYECVFFNKNPGKIHITGNGRQKPKETLDKIKDEPNNHVNVQPFRFTTQTGSGTAIINGGVNFNPTRTDGSEFEKAYDYGALIPSGSLSRLDILQYALAIVRTFVIALDEKIRLDKTQQHATRKVDLFKRDFYIRKFKQYRDLYLNNTIRLKPYHPISMSVSKHNPNDIIISHLYHDILHISSNSPKNIPLAIEYPESKLKIFSQFSKSTKPTIPIIISNKLVVSRLLTSTNAQRSLISGLYDKDFFKSLHDTMIIPLICTNITVPNGDLSTIIRNLILDVSLSQNYSSLIVDNMLPRKDVSINIQSIGYQKYRTLTDKSRGDLKNEIDMINFSNIKYDEVMKKCNDIDITKPGDIDNLITYLERYSDIFTTNENIKSRDSNIHITTSSKWIDFLTQRIGYEIALLQKSMRSDNISNEQVHNMVRFDKSNIAHRLHQHFTMLSDSEIDWMAIGYTGISKVSKWIDNYVYYFQKKQIMVEKDNFNFEKLARKLKPLLNLKLKLKDDKTRTERLESGIFDTPLHYECIIFKSVKISPNTEFAICMNSSNNQPPDIAQIGLNQLENHLKISDFKMVGLDEGTILYYPYFSKMESELNITQHQQERQQHRITSFINANIIPPEYIYKITRSRQGEDSYKNPAKEQHITLCRASIIRIDKCTSKVETRSKNHKTPTLTDSHNKMLKPRLLLELYHVLKYLIAASEQKIEKYNMINKSANILYLQLDNFLKGFKSFHAHPMYWIPYSARGGSNIKKVGDMSEKPTNKTNKTFGVVPFSIWMLPFIIENDDDSNRKLSLDFINDIKTLLQDKNLISNHISAYTSPEDKSKFSQYIANTLISMDYISEPDQMLDNIYAELSYQSRCFHTIYSNRITERQYFDRLNNTSGNPNVKIKGIQMKLELTRNNSNTPTIQLTIPNVSIYENVDMCYTFEYSTEISNSESWKQITKYSPVSKGNYQRQKIHGYVDYVYRFFKKSQSKLAQSGKYENNNILASRIIFQKPNDTLSSKVLEMSLSKLSSERLANIKSMKDSRETKTIPPNNDVFTFRREDKSIVTVAENRFHININDRIMKQFMEKIYKIRRWWSFYDNKALEPISLKEILDMISPIVQIYRYILMVSGGSTQILGDDSQVIQLFKSSKISIDTPNISGADENMNTAVHIFPENITFKNRLQSNTFRTTTDIRMMHTFPYMRNFGRHFELNMANFITPANRENNAGKDTEQEPTTFTKNYNLKPTIVSFGIISKNGERYEQVRYEIKDLNSYPGKTLLFDEKVPTMLDMESVFKDIFARNYTGDLDTKSRDSLSKYMEDLVIIISEMIVDNNDDNDRRVDESINTPIINSDINRGLKSKDTLFILNNSDTYHKMETLDSNNKSYRMPNTIENPCSRVELLQHSLKEGDMSDIYSFLLNYEESCRLLDESVGCKYWSVAYKDVFIPNNYNPNDIFNSNKFENQIDTPTTFLDEVMDCFDIKMWVPTIKNNNTNETHVRYPNIDIRTLEPKLNFRHLHNINIYSEITETLATKIGNLDNLILSDRQLREAHLKSTNTKITVISCQIANMIEFSTKCKNLIDSTISNHCDLVDRETLNKVDIENNDENSDHRKYKLTQTELHILRNEISKHVPTGITIDLDTLTYISLKFIDYYNEPEERNFDIRKIFTYREIMTIYISNINFNLGSPIIPNRINSKDFVNITKLYNYKNNHTPSKTRKIPTNKAKPIPIPENTNQVVNQGSDDDFNQYFNQEEVHPGSNSDSDSEYDYEHLYSNF